MPLVHLGCPSCGGTLSLAEGQRVVTCRYCGGESLALIPDAIPRHVVALGISRDAAQNAAQSVLSGRGRPPALRRDARIQQLSLCYVPFYELTGTRLGTFRLAESVKAPPQTEGREPDEEFQRWLVTPCAEKVDTRVIQQEYLRIGPACTLPELGVDRLPLDAMRRGTTPVTLEPYDPVTLQSRATVFAPTVPPTRFSGEAQWRVQARGDRTGIVERRLKILYYPIWQARYRYAGRPYEIAVDGVTGTVLRARVPVDIRRAAAIAVGALALAAFLFGRLARALLSGGLAAGAPGLPLALAAGGAAAIVLAWLGWRAFSQGGEASIDGGAFIPLMEDGGGAGALGGMMARLAARVLAPGPGPRGQG